MKRSLNSIYRKLLYEFGPQKWWPADTDFEVMIGAILTQNTNWKNVEQAIANLKDERVLTPQKMRQLSLKKIAKLITPAGFFNIKAKRIKEFLNYLFDNYAGSIKKMLAKDVLILRQELLLVNGIGPETADSILLYALNKPVFVVDAYTKRVLSRHKLIKADALYQDVQNIFMKNLNNDVKLFNEYHALLVKLAKIYCLKSNPKCESCPLGEKR